MTPTRQGSFHLFRFAGIDVFLHWSWFVLAVIEMEDPMHRYSSVAWNFLEYICLFGLVLLHEFGHSLACKQVGGRAEQIVLWPLGGVAYVDPPQRPGATLWSIAAGPLVNVILLPVLLGLGFVSQALGWPNALPDVHKLIIWAGRINLGLLCFNLLPVYPLDGGQIVRSLLWFFIGRGRSLMVAATFGFAVAGLVLALLLFTSPDLFASSNGIFLLAVIAFALLNSWRGLQEGRALARLETRPRNHNFRCPGCNSEPPSGAIWMCGQCRHSFDTFESAATCPHCGAQFGLTRCMECGGLYAIDAWRHGSTPPGFPPA